MDAHDEVRALLDKIRETANALASPKARTEIEDATDCIEVLTKAYLVDDLDLSGCKFGLTRNQRRFVNLLKSRVGHTFTKEAILDAMYFDRHDPPGIKIVDVFICKMRSALEEFDAPYRIETVWGTGYRLVKKEDYVPTVQGGALSRARAERALGMLATR